MGPPPDLRRTGGMLPQQSRFGDSERVPGPLQTKKRRAIPLELAFRGPKTACGFETRRCLRHEMPPESSVEDLPYQPDRDGHPRQCLIGCAEVICGQNRKPGQWARDFNRMFRPPERPDDLEG